MTSGPAPMFSQFDTLNGGSSNLASLNWSCCVPRYEAIFKLVPAGTLWASGAVETPLPSAAALLPAQPLSPATPAAAPSSGGEEEPSVDTRQGRGRHGRTP